MSNRKTIWETVRETVPDEFGFDTALPQPWVDEIVALGADPRGRFVWLYDSVSPCFGRPFYVSDPYPDQARLSHDRI